MINDFKKTGVVKLSATGNASFSAYRANRNEYNGLSNPVIGFDDFRLSSDVFGPHQHRHMSAVSYLFDDSAPYHNSDSMGSDLTITPGSLLWTWAGSGVTHHEFPETGNSKIHGLQLFLDIPSSNRHLSPQSVFIPVEQMPLQESDGVRIKVVAGRTGDLINPIKTPDDISFFDLSIAAGKDFSHTLPAGWNGILYVLSGSVNVTTPAGDAILDAHDTIAFGSSAETVRITLRGKVDAHLLFITGAPVL